MPDDMMSTEENSWYSFKKYVLAVGDYETQRYERYPDDTVYENVYEAIEAANVFNGLNEPSAPKKIKSWVIPILEDSGYWLPFKMDSYRDLALNPPVARLIHTLAPQYRNLGFYIDFHGVLIEEPDPMRWLAEMSENPPIVMVTGFSDISVRKNPNNSLSLVTTFLGRNLGTLASPLFYASGVYVPSANRAAVQKHYRERYQPRENGLPILSTGADTSGLMPVTEPWYFRTRNSSLMGHAQLSGYLAQALATVGSMDIDNVLKCLKKIEAAALSGEQI